MKDSMLYCVHTETWLTNNNTHLIHLDNYCSYHLVRQTRPQGGVSVFVSNNIRSEQSDELNIINEHIEINTIKLNNRNRPNSKNIAVEEFIV